MGIFEKDVDYKVVKKDVEYIKKLWEQIKKSDSDEDLDDMLQLLKYAGQKLYADCKEMGF